MAKNKSVLILCAVIALGLILRLYNLTAKPLWYDETGFIAHALKGLDFMMHPVAIYKIPYIILLKVWIAVFGIGAFATRLLSVLFGIASIALTYKLGKNLFNAGVGLIASFLLSISSFHIYHSQQVKHYSFLLFLVLLSFVFFIDFLKRKKSGILIVNLLLNILIVCTHPFGISVVLVQLFYVIGIHRSLDRDQLKRWLCFQLPLALFLGLWACVLIAGGAYFKAILWWVRLPTIQSLIDTFRTFSYGGPAYGLSSLEYTSFPPGIAGAMMLAFGIFFIRGFFLTFSQQAKSHQVFAVIWLVVPIVSIFLFSYLFSPVYLIKDFLFFLPAFYLIVAKGIYHKRRWFSLTILVIIFLLNIIPLKTMYSASINVDWQKAVRFIKDNDLKDDDIIIMATTKEVVSFMYFLSNADKAALKDMLIFGKFEGGRWQESFQYKNHFIITFGIEQNQGKAGYRDPDAGLNMMHSLSYITSDFDRKVMQQESIINSNRQIWLLISRWEDDANGSARVLSDKLKMYFELTLINKVGGIKIYRFKPRK